MKIPNRNNLLISVLLAIFVAVIVSFFWATGEKLVSLTLQFIQSEEYTFTWWKVVILICIGGVFGFLVEKFEVKKFLLCAAFFLVGWFIASYLALKFFDFNLMSLAVLFVVLLTFLVVHIKKLWTVDTKLTNKLIKLASNGNILGDNLGDVRVESGFKLLETVLPLSEIIVFQYNESGDLNPVGRSQNSNKAESHSSRQKSWQEIIQICEESLSLDKTVLQEDNSNRGKAKIALPLISEDITVGVLFVDIKQGFEKDDQYLLEAFSEQLARDFQRSNLKVKNLPYSSWINFLSTTSLKNRLNLITLVNNKIKEQFFSVAAISYLKEAHAIAYLDGTIGYVNKQMRHLTKVDVASKSEMSLFSLLDRFKTEIFNEPSIAIRRVLQTGKPYQCELVFPESDRILDLRISLVKASSEEQSFHQTGITKKPACFLITVSDITHLKENVKLRSDMVNLMSHELRTPITSIQGFAEMLMMEEGIPEDSREYLSVIANESQRASKILSNFLSVAHLEQDDKQEFFKSPVRVNKVVTEVVSNMQNVAKNKRIRLVEKQGEYIPPVSADKGLITKAISLLVDNAIKYSPERTSVMISTFLESDFLRVEVEDRGYGIPATEQEKIWQKFYRVSRDGQDKEEESTGLGLSLVKKIIEQHKGQVELKSKVGYGSKFSIRIPRL